VYIRAGLGQSSVYTFELINSIWLGNLAMLIRTLHVLTQFAPSVKTDRLLYGALKVVLFLAEDCVNKRNFKLQHPAEVNMQLSLCSLVTSHKVRPQF
jgi:hypothetical protein